MFLLQENFRTWKTHPETCMPIKILSSCLVHKHQYIHVNIHVKNPWKMSILGGATSRKIWKYVALNTCMGYFSNIKCSLEMWCDLISYVKHENSPFQSSKKFALRGLAPLPVSLARASACGPSPRAPVHALVAGGARAYIAERWSLSGKVMILKGGVFRSSLCF